MPMPGEKEVMRQLIEEINDQTARQMGRTITTVKPQGEPMRVVKDLSEGIEPLFQKEYLRRSKARQDAYDKDLQKCLSEQAEEEFLDKLCKEIGSVGTGRDNPPRKGKK